MRVLKKAKIKTLTNEARTQKMTTLMLDSETRIQLEQLAAGSETQPGNRSDVVRRLIRDAFRREVKK